MSYGLLPTPQQITIEKKPPYRPLDTEKSVAFGPASPLCFAPEVDQTVRREVADWVSTGLGATPLSLSLNRNLAPEASKLLMTKQAIEVVASDHAGWRYGLARLRQLGYGGVLPLGQIDDTPALAMRGYHFFFKIPDLDFESAKRMLESMARWRLNAVLLEYESRFPYRDHATISTPNALTRQQVAELVAYAQALGIEPIPLQQCLGHMDYVLCHDAYADLREEEMHRDQLCPLNPCSIELFRDLVDDMLELHPGIRYMHIGGDETRRLGDCPRCAAVANEHGKGKLYLDYYKQAVATVCSRGLTPIIWDDMLCKHPEIIDQMPREAVIMYWDYWTTCNPSALFVARPAGFGVINDTSWNGQRKNEMSEIERRTIQYFSNSLNFTQELPPEFLTSFSQYLGPDFPKKIRAFPYLEYYQDLGFRVIGAPTGSGNTSTWRQMPDFPRYGDNIHAFSKRIYEAGALGMITTAWYPVPLEALTPGIMYTGQFAWNPDVTD